MNHSAEPVADKADRAGVSADALIPAVMTLGAAMALAARIVGFNFIAN